MALFAFSMLFALFPFLSRFCFCVCCHWVPMKFLLSIKVWCILVSLKCHLTLRALSSCGCPKSLESGKTQHRPKPGASVALDVLICARLSQQAVHQQHPPTAVEIEEQKAVKQQSSSTQKFRENLPRS